MNKREITFLVSIFIQSHRERTKFSYSVDGFEMFKKMNNKNALEIPMQMQLVFMTERFNNNDSDRPFIQWSVKVPEESERKEFN